MARTRRKIRTDDAGIPERTREQLARSIGEHLRTERERRGLTQGEMAAALGLTRVTVNGLECGRTAPDLVTLRRLVTVLGMDTDTLLDVDF